MFIMFIITSSDILLTINTKCSALYNYQLQFCTDIFLHSHVNKHYIHNIHTYIYID